MPDTRGQPADCGEIGYELKNGDGHVKTVARFADTREAKMLVEAERIHICAAHLQMHPRDTPHPQRIQHRGNQPPPVPFALRTRQNINVQVGGIAPSS